MAAGLIASLMNAVNASLAAQAAKSTMDMNKKKEETGILDDGLLSKSNTKAKEGNKYKTFSKSEIDDLVLLLVEGGVPVKEAMNVAKTGYISPDTLKKLPVDLRRKLSRMTGQELEAQLGLGPGDDNDDDKKDKAKKLRDEAEKEQREWEKKETEFQRNDPKVKRRVDAKDAWHKANRETPHEIDPKDPKHLGNTPKQKMEQGEARMKQAMKNGTGTEWEYQHVTPTSNIPMRP